MLMNKSFLSIAGYVALVAIVAFVALFGIGPVPSISEKVKLGLDIEGGVAVVYEAQTDLEGEELSKLINQTKSVLENRVNELGLTEPVVSVQGDKRIRVELPGLKDIQQAVDSIGKTAKLEFVLVDKTSSAAEGMDKSEFISEPILEGVNVKDSGMSTDNNGRPAVSLSFDDEGTKLFYEATKKAVNNNSMQIAILLDGKVISAPFANVIIADGKAIISGNFTLEETRVLSSLIRGGALPVELKEVQSSLIGSTLGQNALNTSIKAGMIGFVLVAAYMIFFYRVPGIVAATGLVLYTVIVMTLLVLMKATLTLPGIAGIVLSIGMAVDANVIIFERLKEEYANGKSIRASVTSGFKRGLMTIMDSNITTIIAAIILFTFGEGAIKGFAITLSIGILTSMFTALVISRAVLVGLANNRSMQAPSLYGIKEAK